MGTPDAPRKTANLYAMDGVLWGTVSEEVRDTPEEIYDYFVSALCACKNQGLVLRKPQTETLPQKVG